ncbi:MAG: HEAT repeat domain-containing protein [Ktedonobacterales bacterium]
MDQRGYTWLLEKLQSPDDVERWSAAQRLVQLRTPEVVPPLVQHLTDSDYPVRFIVANGLGSLGDMRAVEPLIACVQDEQEDDIIRAAAANSLGILRDARAVEPLIGWVQRLPDEDTHRTQAFAAEALGLLGDRRAVEPLLALIQLPLPHGRVRECAAEALGWLGDARAVEPLITFFQVTVYDPSEHQAALQALERLGEGRVVDLLCEDLLRPRPPSTELDVADLQTWAAQALGRLGDARTIAPLVSCLQDPAPLVRFWAVWALEMLLPRLSQPAHTGDETTATIRKQLEMARMGEQLLATVQQAFSSNFHVALKVLGEFKQFALARCTELLLPYLQDPLPEQRTVAAWGLAHLGDARAVEPLVAGLTQALDALDGAWMARNIAALKRFVDQQAAEPLIAYFPDSVRLDHIIDALGQLGDARAVEPLIAYFQRAVQVRQTPDAGRVARTLGRLGDARAVEPLLACLADECNKPYGYDLGVVLTEALGQVGDARAVEPLCTQLQHSSQELRVAAARALQQLGDPRAVEPLITSLHDPYQLVIGTAADALGTLGDARALAPLRALLGDHDTERFAPTQGWDQAVRRAVFQLEWAQLGDGEQART